MTGSSRFASDTQSLQEKVRQIRLDAQEKQRWWCWSLCYTSESSKETCRAPALSRVICKSLQKRWLGCLYKTKETNGLKTIGGEEGGIPESSSAPAACLKRIISLFNVGVGFFFAFPADSCCFGEQCQLSFLTRQRWDAVRMNDSLSPQIYFSRARWLMNMCPRCILWPIGLYYDI